MDGALPRHDDAGPAQCNLGDDIGTLGIFRAHRFDLFFERQFLGDRLERSEGHGHAGFAAEFAHPFKLVPLALQVACHFEHAITDPAHRTADADQFVLGRRRAGNQHAIHRFVEDRARRRKTKCTGPQAFLDDLRHLGNVGFGRRFVVRTTLTHHIGTDGTVRHMRPHINRARQTLKRIEIFGKCFPVPGHAFGKRGAGNILNALHKADQPVMLVLLGRRKADAAIAHDDGGDAVPA